MIEHSKEHKIQDYKCPECKGIVCRESNCEKCGIDMEGNGYIVCSQCSAKKE